MNLRTLKKLELLVTVLADGEFHSGQDIADKLNVSRTAIWKLINRLKEWDIEFYSVRGKGYKIPGGLSLIKQDYLDNHLVGRLKLFNQIEVKPTIDSTSSYLARKWNECPNVSRICISEHQTEGRGRKGQKWISPFGANLYFSLGLGLPIGLSALGGLSIAVGLTLTKQLNELSNQKISLKWPNDLLVSGRKLAGILVEASGDTNDKSFLNIGIGINWDMSSAQTGIDQPWINLKEILQTSMSRNQLLVSIIKALDSGLALYLNNGFDSFYEDWPKYSAFHGKPIVIYTHTNAIQGQEIGIDKSGAIRIMTQEGEKSFFSGEVSLRSAD